MRRLTGSATCTVTFTPERRPAVTVHTTTWTFETHRGGHGFSPGWSAVAAGWCATLDFPLRGTRGTRDGVPLARLAPPPDLAILKSDDRLDGHPDARLLWPADLGPGTTGRVEATFTATAAAPLRYVLERAVLTVLDQGFPGRVRFAAGAAMALTGAVATTRLVAAQDAAVATPLAPFCDHHGATVRALEALPTPIGLREVDTFPGME